MTTATKPRIVKPDGKGSTSLAVDRLGGHVFKFEDDGGGLFLTSSGMKSRGKPNFGSFESAMDMAVYMSDAAPFWKADLLEYASKRPDWEGLIDTVIDAGTFTEATVSQYRYVSRAVPASRRVEGLSMGHHEKVAALEPDDQTAYLQRAKREHLSVSDLQRVIRKERKVRRVLSGQSSEMATLHNAIKVLALEAADECREIYKEDCRNADRSFKRIRVGLDKCEDKVTAFRKAQGKL